MREFRRARDGNEWLGGVCAGVAYCMGWRTWLVRLIWAVAVFATGAVALLPYILLCVFAPKWETLPKDFYTVTEGEDAEVE